MPVIFDCYGKMQNDKCTGTPCSSLLDLIPREHPTMSGQATQSIVYFLPLFLMPCWPVFRGPFPPALAAISFLAFSSVEMSAAGCAPNRVDYTLVTQDSPARFFSRKTLSSSSSSFFSFLGAFRGLTLPPVGVVVAQQAGRPNCRSVSSGAGI